MDTRYSFKAVFNIFRCQHDSHLWKDPYCVDPDRFLDSDRGLVPADHPNTEKGNIYTKPPECVDIIHHTS